MWSSIVCNNRVITLELSKPDLNSRITRQLLFHYSTRGSRECLGNSLVSVTFIMRDLPPKFSNQNQEQEPPQALQICVSVMCAAAAAAYHNSLLFVLRLLRRRHFKGNSTQLHLAVPQFHRILCQQRNNSEITTTTPAVNNHFEGKHQTSSRMLLLIRNNTKATPHHNTTHHPTAIVSSTTKVVRKSPCPLLFL